MCRGTIPVKDMESKTERKGCEDRSLLMDGEKELGPVGLGSWGGHGIIVGNLRR